jgi:CubicO group peptidase (beta-lactamase class C family)
MQSKQRLFCLLFTLISALPSLADQDRAVPDSEWPGSEPAAQNVDVSVLDALDREFASGKHGYIDSMLVIRNGFLVYARSYKQDYDAPFREQDQARGPYNYFDPDWHPWFERGPLHTMQSVSKSVTSMLIGIAIGRGEIAGVDTPVMPFFDAYPSDDRDPRWQEITLRDFLTMTSGIEWDESSVPYTDPANSCASMEASDDWIRYVLDQPMRESPGERFEYNSGVTMLLAHILVKATGRQVDDYAREHLFRPLGIDNFYWKKTPTGLNDAEGGLYLEPADLARLGFLVAKDGVWNERRILPAGWVAQSMQPATQVPDWEGRYGFQWWLLPYDGELARYAYAGLGYGGQLLLIVPEYALIAVFTGWNIYDVPSLDGEFALQRVLEAVRSGRGKEDAKVSPDR